MLRPAFPGALNRDDPELTERQRQVFVAVVHTYGRTARPVGSDQLARAARLRLSAASIRGVLGELESLGLLERSHASAGRVPSPPGYRMFVRTELQTVPLPPELVREVEERLR